MNYEECTLFEKGNCGDFKKYRAATDGLFTNEKLDGSVTAHFQELKVKANPEEWDELTLTENRLGRSLREGEKLCAYHWFINGVAWKESKKCNHPNHAHCSNKKKTPVTRTVPIPLLEKISDKYKCNLSIGTVMCYNHIKEEQPNTKCSDETEFCQDELPYEQSRDPDYEPQEIIISSPVLNTSVESSKSLANGLDKSPLRFTVKKKMVEDLSEETKKYLKRKHKQ